LSNGITFAALSRAACRLRDELPAVRIGRLAVDQDFQGRGLGAALLADAAARTLNAAPAFTLQVDAKSLIDTKKNEPVAFYQHYGFRALASRPRTLFLPLATARKVFLQKDAH
jgi:predicted GNAT family N-acyltransferase